MGTVMGLLDPSSMKDLLPCCWECWGLSVSSQPLQGSPWLQRVASPKVTSFPRQPIPRGWPPYRRYTGLTMLVQFERTIISPCGLGQSWQWKFIAAWLLLLSTSAPSHPRWVISSACSISIYMLNSVPESATLKAWCIGTTPTHGR